MHIRIILDLEADVAPGEATLEELTEAAREAVSFTSPSQIGKIGCGSGRLFSRVHVEQANEVMDPSPSGQNGESATDNMAYRMNLL